MTEQPSSGPSRGPSPIQGRFAQVNLIITDMSASMAFYRLLGVEVAGIPAPWDAHHRTVTNGADQFTVEFDSQRSVQNWAPEWAAPPAGVMIGISVESDDDVDEAADLVASHGHPILQPPHDAFFGARYAVVQDPDRHPVGIMGPIRPDRHWMPAPPN